MGVHVNGVCPIASYPGLPEGAITVPPPAFPAEAIPSYPLTFLFHLQTWGPGENGGQRQLGLLPGDQGSRLQTSAEERRGPRRGGRRGRTRGLRPHRLGLVSLSLL